MLYFLFIISKDYIKTKGYPKVLFLYTPFMNQHEAISTLLPIDAFLISMLKNGIRSPISVEKTKHKDLLTQANLHGIIPQLYKTLSKQPNTPEDVIQVFQKPYKHILQANLLLTAHLLTITKTLTAKGFHYLAIKGPVLAQELYGDISMRQYSDIDLFVEEKDIVKIAEELILLGFKPVLPLSLLSRQRFLELDNDFSFKHVKNNALVELHWKLFPLRHQMPLDFKELYTASKTTQLQNRDIKTLSTEDNLLYLSLHGAKHIFERYEWVYDLHTLIQNNADLNLETIYLKAQKEEIDTPFLLGIFLSHTLFKTELPESFFRHKSEHIEVLLNKALAYYQKGFVHWDESDKKRARFLFLSELFQNTEPKTLWLFKSLVKATPVDVIAFNLPDKLAFLYPLLRPFRLLYKHLFTKKPVYA